MRNSFFNEKKNTNSGFTLVEMIVVLVILGILASAAVYSIVGYINLTRYRNNNEDALSIYQSAQNAVNHLENSGTSESLALKILNINSDPSIPGGIASAYNPDNSDGIDNIYNQTFFDAFPASMADAAPGQSAHMRYAVTYTPGGSDVQSKLIYDLISQDFSSTDLFKGIITIEFDVEKILDNNGEIVYSVYIYYVLYDSGRTSWDNDIAKNNGKGGIVPFRDTNYRSDKSFIGYFSGSGTPQAVDTVILPSDSEIKNTIFTLRNGETLDVTWSATAEGIPVTGMSSNIHYTISLYDYDTKGTVVNNKICDLVVNENSVLGGIPQATLSGTNWYDLLHFERPTSPTNFPENSIGNVIVSGNNIPVVYTSESVSDRRGVPITIYKATVRTSARVYVHRVTNVNRLDNFDYNALTYDNLTSVSNYYTFPLTISYEIHEGDGVSDRISYTLSLDAMMSRNIVNNAENTSLDHSVISKTLNYSINRLFTGSYMPKNAVPKNIYAEMFIAPNNFSDTGNAVFNDISGFTQSDIFTAERALDDPVYLLPNGTYRYVANRVFKESGKKFAIVNSYFGDLDYGSFGTRDKNSSDPVDAVIMSFRHLSNMRMLRHYGYPVNYSICRDLNWYKIGPGNTYSSEVIVYTSNGGSGLVGHSPVHWPLSGETGTYGTRLDVVSFPSIPSTDSKATLRAIDNTLSEAADGEDKTSVINNVQMRMPSFYDTDLDSYGLICTNYGHIINIRANGITLTLDDVADGSPDDRERIKNAVGQLADVNHSSYSTAYPSWKPSSPVGGLVGANNGILGSESETDTAKNTIKVSNCIVLSGQWNATANEWETLKVSAVGGIVGDNNGLNATSSAYGVLEATGRFAASGWIDVSSIVGYSKANIDALLKVDNTKDTDKAIVAFDNGITSLLFGTSDAIGGAVGSCKNSSTFYQGASAAPLSHTIDSEGRITFTQNSNPVYAIDVNLDAGSYIICKTNDAPKQTRPSGFGGAVGRIEAYGGNTLSIRVINDGVILSSSGKTYDKHVGGAVGVITGGTITQMYIYVENGTHSRIGTVDNTNIIGYADTTGGAIGRINDLKGLVGTAEIAVINRGTIAGNCTRNTDPDANAGRGVGGAIGSIVGSNNSMPYYFISASNFGKIFGNTIVHTGNDGKNNYGVGGAVGYVNYMPRASAIYSLMATGSSIHTTGNNAGGCIGTQSGNLSSDPGSLYTTITANLQNGVSVVADNANAGGCIGNSGCLHKYFKVRTIVTGNVSVRASSDVGGIAGRFRPSADNATSKIYLISTTATSSISIRAAASDSDDPASGNENAGGLIGVVADSGNDFNIELNLPTQTGTNMMIVRVESYDNAGGMIGDLKNSHKTNSAMNVVFHPSSYVHAFNNNAGGCIGLLEASSDFTSNVTVSDAAVTSTDTPFILAGTPGTAGQNAGGLIGHINKNLKSSGAFEFNTEKISVIAVEKNAGGCIGSAEGGVTLGGTVKTTGTGFNISGTGNISSVENTGGVIGYCSNCHITGFVTTDMTSMYVSGTTNTGGVIGQYRAGKISTDAAIRFDGTNSYITGVTSTGGCIGAMTAIDNNNRGEIYGKIHFAGSTNYITGTSDNTGGIIGLITDRNINDNASIIFASTDTTISGSDNTGGIFGMMNKGTASSKASFTFSGTDTDQSTYTISGNNNVGGLIGKNYSYLIEGKFSLTPGSYCGINGRDNVGGIVGYGTGGSAKFPNSIADHTEIYLDNDKLVINAVGYAGGFGGRFDSSTWFSGSEIRVLEGSTLSITSSEKSAGGQVGYMTGMNLGDGSKLTLECVKSSVSIKGSTAAGGLIGITEASITGNFFLKSDSSSTFTVTATGTNAGAGGIIGISEAKISKGKNTSKNIYVPNGGTISVRADNGYAGGIMGINNNTFQYENSYVFYLNVSVRDKTGDVTEPSDMVIGLKNGTDKDYKYVIDGTEYLWNYVPTP